MKWSLCSPRCVKSSQSSAEDLLSADKLVEFLVDKRLHRLRANVPLGRQLAEATQGFLFRVRADDQDAVVISHRPILAFDFNTRFGRDLVEVVSTVAGFFKVFCTLFGESKETNILGHKILSFCLSVRCVSCARPATPRILRNLAGRGGG